MIMICALARCAAEETVPEQRVCCNACCSLFTYGQERAVATQLRQNPFSVYPQSARSNAGAVSPTTRAIAETMLPQCGFAVYHSNCSVV